MCPSDKRPRLYASGLRSCKKREKNRRLDNAVADTSQIQSLNFVTTTLSEGGGSMQHHAWTGSPIVRPDARQPDGWRSLSARHIAKLSETGNPSSLSMPPKRTVCYQQREWQQSCAFSRKHTTMHMLGLCEYNGCIRLGKFRHIRSY